MIRPPFKKLLIANRGEIALRIIRACHELGIRTVAVHSTADEEALHVKLANESVCIGPPLATDSYLKVASIISAAVSTGAEAIHPGYGFLSENAPFAEICSQCGITFVGPNVRNMQLMGDKAKARQVAINNNVPVIPGSGGAGIDVKTALAEARKIGFPVLIKATAGGGGRGMKIVRREEEFEQAFEQAKHEVEAAFNDPNVYIEKYIEISRHVEVQIAADRFNNVIHMGDRDCSVQRRYQKVIEECPAFGLSDETRKKLHDAAIKLARSIDYTSVGTVEFLLNPKTEEFYFIEMNTRLQVEHPVTEMVNFVDVVKEQIWAAAGRELSYKQEDIQVSGHAVEARINAEDSTTFLPCPGRIEGYHPPGGPGIRVDSAVYDGYSVPPYYDSLVAKLVAHASNREEAIRKLEVSLGEFLIDGIKTNVELHRKILSHPDFIKGDIHTRFLDSLLG